MYSDWASLTTEIQTNSAAQSVLSRFNYASAKNIIQAVMKDLKASSNKQGLENGSNSLKTDAHVEWTMQVQHHGFQVVVCFFANIFVCDELGN